MAADLFRNGQPSLCFPGRQGYPTFYTVSQDVFNFRYGKSKKIPQIFEELGRIALIDNVDMGLQSLTAGRRRPRLVLIYNSHRCGNPTVA